MFPAARKLDPTTHDLLAPSGLIGPPITGPCPGVGLVMIEALPAAHVTCTAVCTGAITGGIAHPPPPGPPPPIVLGSPTVLIHGKPAARWAPSGDIAGCLAFLGNPALSAARTVLIGNGAASVPVRIAIVAGSAFDSPAGRARIAEMVARMQEVTGMHVQVTEVVTIDDSALRNMTGDGPWNGADNYTGGEALEALNAVGSPDTPTAIFTDEVTSGGDAQRGFTVANAWAGTNDSIPNEGVVVSDSADNETFTHEMGHLLTGLGGTDLHSTDPNNIMAGGETGRTQWTDPWRSAAEGSPYVTPP